jgi:hypothetical protein
MMGIPPPGAKSFELPAARVCPDATPAPSAKQEPGAPGFPTALPAAARQFEPATSTEQEGATVRSYAAMMDAERAARRVPGITEVENRLTVEPTAYAPV